MSTGVGLPNIRDRLSQAYGEEQSFEIRTPATGGFMVVIELPHEVAEADGEVSPVQLPGTPPKLAAPAQGSPDPAVQPEAAPHQIGTQI